LVQQHQLTPDYTAPNSTNSSTHSGQLNNNSHQSNEQQQANISLWAGDEGQQKQRQWQEEQLKQQRQGLAQQQMLVCIVENRGMGRSSCPRDSAAYSTSIMAHDVVAVMVSGQWCAWPFSCWLYMCGVVVQQQALHVQLQQHGTGWAQLALPRNTSSLVLASVCLV
jgi:hypothetical protein